MKAIRNVIAGGGAVRLLITLLVLVVPAVYLQTCSAPGSANTYKTVIPAAVSKYYPTLFKTIPTLTVRKTVLSCVRLS